MEAGMSIVEMSCTLLMLEHKSQRLVRTRSMEPVSKLVRVDGKDSGLAVLGVLEACKWFVQYNFLGISQISHRRGDLVVSQPTPFLEV
jgi:hypothetical protein